MLLRALVRDLPIVYGEQRKIIRLSTGQQNRRKDAYCALSPLDEGSRLTHEVNLTKERCLREKSSSPAGQASSVSIIDKGRHSIVA
jgi:hypothetical protein